MSSQDDPEARIRELERSLGSQTSELTQSSSELGPGGDGGPPPLPPPLPPPPQAPYPAHMPYAAPQSPYPAPTASFGAPYPPVSMTSAGRKNRGLLAFVVVGAVLVFIVAGVAVYVSSAFSGFSPSAPYGATSRPSGASRPPAPSLAPTETVVPPGGDVNVSGVGGNRTIACNDNIVNVSGVSNTVVLTGQCRSVRVSGVENVVTVDAAAAIEASGFNNRVTFHTGSPDIQNPGDSNVVAQG